MIYGRRRYGFGDDISAVNRGIHLSESVSRNFNAAGNNPQNILRVLHLYKPSAQLVISRSKSTSIPGISGKPPSAAQVKAAYDFLYEIDTRLPRRLWSEADKTRVPAWLVNQIKQRTHSAIMAATDLQINVDGSVLSFAKTIAGATHAAGSAVAGSGVNFLRDPINTASKGIWGLLPWYVKAGIFAGGTALVLGIYKAAKNPQKTARVVSAAVPGSKVATVAREALSGVPSRRRRK